MAKTVILAKLRIVPLLLILIFLFIFCVPNFTIETDAFVLETATVVFVAASIVYAGVMLMSDTDLMEAAKILIYNMPEYIRMIVNDLLFLVSDTAGYVWTQVVGDKYNQLINWIKSFFLHGEQKMTLFGIMGYFVEENIGIPISELPVLISTLKQNGNYEYYGYKFTQRLTVYDSSMTMQLSLSNGVSLYSHASYGSTTNGLNEIRIHQPLIRQFTDPNYNTVQWFCSIPTQYSGSIHTVNFTVWHLSGTDNTDINDTRLYYNSSTKKIYTSKDGIVTIFDGEYQNVNHFIYNYLIGAASIPINYTTTFPIQAEFEDDDIITISFPDNITDIVTGGVDVINVDTGAITIPNVDALTGDETLDKFKMPTGIFGKFPFCIPYDIYHAFSIMAVYPEAPVFELPFKFERLGIDYTITIDFADYYYLANIMRWFLSMLFIISLIVGTRKLIKG